MRLYLALLALCFSVTGCGPSLLPMAIATVQMNQRTDGGPDLDTDFVKNIQKGKTTMEEVRANLGKPTSVTESGDQQDWSYVSMRDKASRLLRIQFKKGVVVDHSLTTTGT